MKQKTFFIFFKGLSIVRNSLRHESAPLNNKINQLHERRLRITNSDKTSNFDEVLSKVGTVSIYLQNS